MHAACSSEIAKPWSRFELPDEVVVMSWRMGVSASRIGISWHFPAASVTQALQRSQRMRRSTTMYVHMYRGCVLL